MNNITDVIPNVMIRMLIPNTNTYHSPTLYTNWNNEKSIVGITNAVKMIGWNGKENKAGAVSFLKNNLHLITK